MGTLRLKQVKKNKITYLIIHGEQGLEMDSWLNIVCFRQGGMGYKLETDVQLEPKSIIKTFISKQDEALGVDL